MAWYNRKKQNEVLPDEVQDYYKAEQRDRMGVAWLLAAGAFVLTVAIIVGLFFAGRWAYQAIFSSDTDTSSQVEESEDGGLPEVTGDEPTAGEPEEDTEDTEDTGDTGDAQDAAEQNSDATADGDDTTDSEDAETTTPATGGSGDESVELPRTGPSSN